MPTWQMHFQKQKFLEGIVMIVEMKSQFILIVSMIHFELERLNLKDARIADISNEYQYVLMRNSYFQFS